MPELLGRRAGLSTGADPAWWGSWEAGIAGARAFGSDAVELCAMKREELATVGGYLGEVGEFAYVSLHAPVSDARGHWLEVAAQLVKLPSVVRTVVVHPDVVGEAEAELLRGLGGRLCFENMDNQKVDGRFPDELERAFSLCPEAAFCLDVAHVWTHDPTMGLAFELLDRFGERLRQVHLSGIDPDSQHRPTTPQDVARYAGAVERCGDVPVILEATLTELC